MSGSGAGAGASKRVSLAQVSVPRLLFALLHQRFTGTLTVDQPPPHAGPRRVWLRGGMPVLTDWVAPAEVLGQVLLGQHLVDEGQLAQALESMAATGGLLGSHLVASGVIDRPQLLEGLRQQCIRKLLHLFALRGGEVTVTVGDTSGLESDLLPLNVLGVLLAGVSATYDEVRVAAEMGATLQETLRVTGALARYRSHFRFRAGDEAVLQGLEPGAQLAQLAALPGTSPRRAAQLVYTLWACQMLKTGAAAEAAPTPAASAPAAGRAAVPTPAPVAARAAAPTPAPAAAAPPRLRRDTPADLEVAMAGASDAFIPELEALEAKLAQGAHAFALFGVPLSATKRDIRSAWAELSRKFHPDALQSQGRRHLRERVSDVFAALSEAQQLLGDAEQRDKLRAAIEKGDHEPRKDGQDATARAHAVFQSELLAKEADKLLRANRFDRALDRYREAASYDADEPDLKAAIAWCEYQLAAKAPADVARIRAALSEVIEQAPRIARAHHFLGFVLSDLGRRKAAIEAFRTAAGLDPRLIDAERQARALELRSASSEAPQAKRSGLKGLFGGGKK
jgi:tetratricopeptide (TPR) repeat protein